MKPILVTGSAALADTPEAKAWAVEALRRELAGCTELWECGRPGTVDEWAVSSVEELKPRPWRMRFSPDGTATLFYPAAPGSLDRWHRYTDGKARLPFVELFRDVFPRGTVLDLLAPWSQETDAASVVKQVREFGLRGVELVCPAELGPKGGT